MEKKIVLNRVDLGNRVVGYEVFNPHVNGGEVLGYTAKQLADAIKAGEVIGMVLDEKGNLKLDEARGFQRMTLKTGAGTLTNSDPSAVANLMYVVYERQDNNYKVITSRFGRLTFCEDKIKALLDLGAVSGVVLTGDKLVCAWELDGEQSKATEATGGKKGGAA